MHAGRIPCENQSSGALSWATIRNSGGWNPPGRVSLEASWPYWHLDLGPLTSRRVRQYTSLICSVQSLSHVWLFATPWTVAHQASLSISNSQSLLKLMSIALVMPSNHLILCLLLFLPPSVFPSVRVCPMSQFFASGGQTTGVSASATVLPMNIQNWFPLGWTVWISLQPKGFSSLLNSLALTILYSPTLTSIYDYWKNHSFD